MTKTPLPKSSARTSAAAFLPAVRNTLVVPIEPLPCSRGSTPLHIRQTMIPTGIEPIRYAMGRNQHPGQQIVHVISVAATVEHLDR